MSHPRSVDFFALLPLVLLFGCGGALEPELASTAEASGGTGTVDASGGAGTAVGSDSLCEENASEPIPILDNCSAVTQPCEASLGGDPVTDWWHTFAWIASACGASCLAVEVATDGNCVTQVRLLNEPSPRDPGITPEAILSCATQKLVARRWECVPQNCWSEVHWNGCILL